MFGRKRRHYRRKKSQKQSTRWRGNFCSPNSSRFNVRQSLGFSQVTTLSSRALSNRLDGLLLGDRPSGRYRASICASTLDAVVAQRSAVLVLIIHIAATLVALRHAIHGRVLGGVPLRLVRLSTVRGASTSIIANDAVQVARRELGALLRAVTRVGRRTRSRTARAILVR